MFRLVLLTSFIFLSFITLAEEHPKLSKKTSISDQKIIHPPFIKEGYEFPNYWSSEYWHKKSTSKFWKNKLIK